MGKLPVGFPGHPGRELANVLNDVTVRVNDSLRNAVIDLEKRPNVIIRKEELPKDSLMIYPKKREHDHFNE